MTPQLPQQTFATLLAERGPNDWDVRKLALRLAEDAGLRKRTAEQPKPSGRDLRVDRELVYKPPPRKKRCQKAAVAPQFPVLRPPTGSSAPVPA